MGFDGGLDDDERRWTLLRLLGWDTRKAQRLAFTFMIGVGGSLLFMLLNLPLPIFLGALTATIVAAVLDAPILRPRWLGPPMRAVLGVAVGAAFTPALIGQMGGMAGSLLVLVPFTLLITIGGMAFFRHVAGYDRATAFFAAVPGGLTDMVTMSADAGADQRRVTLIHATRIALIMFTVPFFIQVANGTSIGSQLPSLVHFWEMRAIDGLMLLVLAAGGHLIAQRLGLAGAPLVGPMLASGLLHAIGLTSAKVPFELLALAQVSLAILLGAQFRGLTLGEFGSTMIWGLLFTVFLLVSTAATSLAVAALTGFDTVSILLAFAPGGQAELSLLALILGLDVAFIALHHLVRLAIIIIGAQAVFLKNSDWQQHAQSRRRP
jgi:membrane AbrB-like protein